MSPIEQHQYQWSWRWLQLFETFLTPIYQGIYNHSVVHDSKSIYGLYLHCFFSKMTDFLRLHAVTTLWRWQKWCKIDTLLLHTIPLLSGFLFFLCSLTWCLAPAPLKLRPYGAIQISVIWPAISSDLKGHSLVARLIKMQFDERLCNISHCFNWHSALQYLSATAEFL